MKQVTQRFELKGLKIWDKFVPDIPPTIGYCVTRYSSRHGHWPQGYMTMTGDVAAVTVVVEAGVNFIRKKGLLVNKVVIPQPRPDVLEDKI